MNRFVFALALACAGATAAFLLMSWRRTQTAAKAHEEDIHRWEDDGGNVPQRATPVT